jgi:hypothetical protein
MFGKIHLMMCEARVPACGVASSTAGIEAFKVAEAMDGLGVVEVCRRGEWVPLRAKVNGVVGHVDGTDTRTVCLRRRPCAGFVVACVDRVGTEGGRTEENGWSGAGFDVGREDCAGGGCALNARDPPGGGTANGDESIDIARGRFDGLAFVFGFGCAAVSDVGLNERLAEWDMMVGVPVVLFECED